MNFVLIGSFAAANSMARCAVAKSTPSISKMIRPGLTTATHPSGAPLPLPMRVSAGFLVIGLSGKIRIQILPPRLTARVIATRAASICRAVIQPGSRIWSPTSPKARLEPRVAFPFIRPRCCLRYLTFDGINMAWLSLSGLPSRLGLVLLAAVDPRLDPDLSVGRVGLGEPVVDVGLQRVEREAPLLVPLGAGDLGPVQPAGAADLDPLGSEAQGRLDPLLHRAAERHAALELQRDGLGDELRVRLRPLDLDDVDVDFRLGPLLELVAELVDFRAALADDDPGSRRLDVDLHPVGEALDVHLGDPRVREAPLQLLAQLDVLVQERLVLLGREPARVPGPVEPEPETVRMDFLTHGAPYPFASALSESSIVRWLLR